MNKENEAIIEMGKRNLKAPNHWELLEIDNLKFDKPTILCISGNGTITNKGANGFAKHAERYLDLLLKTKDGNQTLDQVDIMGIKYIISKTTAIGGLDENIYDNISNAILELLVDRNGNKLELNQAKKNMSRITFFTYCAGNQELQNIIYSLNDKMALVGYSQNEIKDINRATLEVSFAPLSVQYNKVPSVRIISLKDSIMNICLNEKLNKLAVDKVLDFDGVCLHQDEPGYLYGDQCETALAGSIQVFSTSLFNAYSEEIDEHLVRLTARDQDWNLKPSYAKGVEYTSPNADCVSQMMAWALCKGVENSIQNFKSKTYVPNNYWQELPDDLNSIINSYKQEKLAQNPILMHNKRKAKFNRIRAKKVFKTAENVTVPRYEEMINTLNNANSLEEVIEYLQQNNFLGVEHILPEVQVLTEQEKKDIMQMATQPEPTITKSGL